MPPRPNAVQSQTPLTSRPFDHTITLNLTLPFVVKPFGHATHVD